MKKLVKISLFIVMGIIFSACSTHYSITYDTKPSCARIVCNGTFEGYAPVTLYYEKDQDYFNAIDDNGVLYTQQCKAFFESGYEGTFDNRIDTDKYPDGLHITITRPQGVGYSQDWDFACSDTCIYSIARRFWSQFSYTYSQQGKSISDIFLEFKRDFYFLGICPRKR